MSFIDKVNKRVDDVKDSARKTSELSRIRRRVNTMTQEAEKLYAQVGKSYFAQFKGGGSKQDALDQMCSLIVTLERDIAALERQSDKLRQVNRCPKCGSVQSNENRFCAECGSKLATEEPVVEEHVMEEPGTEEPVTEEHIMEEPVIIEAPAAADEIILESRADESSDVSAAEDAEVVPKPKRARASKAQGA
jgi:uncharacterized OB-fold protein